MNPSIPTKKSLACTASNEATRLESLQQAWQQGIHGGDNGALDFAELLTEAQRKLAASRTG